EINQELDTVDLLFQKLQRHAAGILDISHTLLLSVYQRQTNTAELYMQEEGRFIHKERRPMRGASQHAIETRQTLFIAHLSLEAERLPFQVAPIAGTEPKESFIFVPLVLRDEPLGALSIQHPEPHAYNQGDRFILELLANHIALALHNIRLYRSLYLLNETGEILTQQLDAEQTLQATVEKIRDATKADLVVLYPYESAYQRFMLPPRIAGTLLDPNSRESMSPNRPGGTAKQIVRRTRPIFARQSAGFADPNDSSRIRQGSFGRREQIYSTAAMPLRVGEEVVGALFINYRQPEHFDAIQKLFIGGLAHYVAIAIKNAQTFGSLSQRRLDELVILQHIDRELSRALLDLDSFLHTVLKLALERVPAEEASISLYNPHTQMLEVSAATGSHAEARRSRTISLHQARGIVHWVLEHKRPARVSNVHEDPQWRDLYIPVVSETIAELDVPILDGEEVVGIFNFESTRAGAFHREDEEFLATLAGQAVLAIKNARAYEREKRLVAEAQMQAQHFALLYKAGQELGKISELAQLNQAYGTILHLAEEHSQCKVVIRRYDDATQELVLMGTSEPGQFPLHRRTKLDEGVNGQVAQERRTIVIQDTYNPPPDVVPLKLSDPLTRSLVIAPIFFKDRYYGNLRLGHEKVHHFHKTDILFFEGLAHQLAITIYRLETTREQHELEQRAIAAEAMSSIGQVAFELTHRLGNDLGLVRTYVNSIRAEFEKLGWRSLVISEKLEDIVQAVRKVLDLSKRLKQELLRWGESSGGEPVIIHPRVLLEEASELPSLPCNIQIDVQIDPDVSTVRVMHGLITDILHNLITNAIEAMVGGGKITLYAHNTGRSVALEVCDTGQGIAEQHLVKVFDLFFSTKESTGFGLWSARRNALSNHGELTVKSEVGKGTTFTLLLPKVEEGL
ncbi:MAG TPA: GAF domain-containing protein, partial [Ktedonobacteraceae bacterium]|nr:GAF domain-containing protein [Ktedonobacteraceae bacterium]